MKSETQGINLIAGDPSDLPASAALAAAFGADALEGTPPLLCAFVPYLKKTMDCSKILFLELTGEVYAGQHAYLRKHFPNAGIGTNLGMSEAAGVIGHSCKWLDQNAPNHIHPLEDMYFIELIDPKTGRPASGEAGGEEGEIVLTHLWESAFPILRLRTGDLARKIPHFCAEHRESTVYKLLGRTNLDRVSLPGGLILSSELERIMRPYEHLIGTDYQLHIFDTEKNGVLRTKAELYIRKSGRPQDIKSLCASLEKNLRVGPEHTYADGVARGLYESIGYVLLTEDSAPSRKSYKKTGRLVRH